MFSITPRTWLIPRVWTQRMTMQSVCKPALTTVVTRRAHVIASKNVPTASGQTLLGRFRAPRQCHQSLRSRQVWAKRSSIGFVIKLPGNDMKLAVAFALLLVVSSADGQQNPLRFSADCYNEPEGVVVFTEKVANKLHLRLSRLRERLIKDREIDEKSSSPIICGKSVVICSYGLNKITVYDYSLQMLSEVTTPNHVVPFFCSCSSDGQFVYVYVVQFGDSKLIPKKFIYRYTCTNGVLHNDGVSPVGAVGKIVEYKGSVYVINDKTCEAVVFSPAGR